MIDIQIQDTEDGLKISVVNNGVVTSEGVVKNGVTPNFKIENDGLYVSYDKEE